MSRVSIARRGTTAVVTIDNPPVNAQSQAVREGLLWAMQAVADDPAVSSVVLCGAGNAFAAGADLTELKAGVLKAPDPNAVHAAIENCPKPVVAALHGATLGGGLEVALACHYRVAAPGTKLGLPEVTLGLLPGAGGTQRLPRLIGVAAALDVMISGAPLTASAAQACGLVDAVADGDLVDAATAFAAACPGVRRVCDRVVDAATLPEGGFAALRESVQRRQSAAMAPGRIVDCVEAAVTLPFAEGLAVERRQFEACLSSPQCAALLHLFFAEREAAKIPGLPKDVTARPVHHVGVVGAGTMGAGIAMAFANVGVPVTLVERGDAALAAGLDNIRKTYDGLVKRGKLTAAQADERLNLIGGSLSYVDLARCDLVIEAVYESMAVKTEVMALLGQACRPGAILATNTSTLDVDALAKASGRPADVVGLHFFSPAHIMRLLEVVRGAETAADVLVTAMGIARTLRKIPVVSGVCFGFIGNRMLEGYLRETDALILQGVAPERIDRALENFGLAMGPCRMMDLAGVDLGAKLVAESQGSSNVPDGPAYRAVVRALAAAGRYGQKNGFGYYRYEGRTPAPDPAVASLAADLAASLGIAPAADATDEEIVRRCVFPLIDEAARILDEGIAYRPGDIDVVWANGYGFPVLKGGPLHYADSLGLDVVRDGLKALGWTPAPLIERLAATGARFSDLSDAKGAR